MLTIKRIGGLLKRHSSLAAYYPPVPCERCGELANGTGMPLHRCDPDRVAEQEREITTGRLMW